MLGQSLICGTSLVNSRLKGAEPPPLPSPCPSVAAPSEGSQVLHRDRGVRSLSRTELEERRKKGLCFRCGQQFGPAHKCPEGKLRVLFEFCCWERMNTRPTEASFNNMRS